MGERSYWVVSLKSNGRLEAVEGKRTLSDYILPDPYALIHPLAEKEADNGAGLKFPSEVATQELARVVAQGLRLRTTEERSEFIKQKTDVKEKYVKDYLEWLSAKK